MAKIKHNNFLNTVHEVFTDAKQEGIMHLYAEGESFTGRTIGVKNRQLFHFGTTGYLGLEQDSRLKAAAMDAICKYGTQFPLSKSYISNPLYSQLEDKLTAMYQNPIIITKNSTLGHMGVIPNAVNDHDVIILDHQVHWSVHSAAKVLKLRSVPIDMIRHNDLNMLEDKIKSYSSKHKRIWYMVDGIYSMYGDYAPILELKTLALKYPQLHLYIDDVHGMSWTGRNGTGYALSELDTLTENILLFGTLSKTFGASGAVLVCSNKKMYQEIKTFGGPLTFSAQLEPASVAAASASADIHLSSEIYELQEDLKERIEYFNALLETTDLPLINKNNSPVFYIGTGMPKTGYNFVNRLMNEGFYVNLGIFPAVPVKNTGVRITISRHNEKNDIKGLVEAMIYHYPKALEDTHTNSYRVNQAFKLKAKTTSQKLTGDHLNIQIEETISKINPEQWNRCMGYQGVFDWEGLQFLEQAFNGHPLIEHNWKFWYVMIYDKDQTLILATYLTLGLWKDDMLTNVNASKIIENERKTDPYYLTSKVLSMGSLFTEGKHLYVHEGHPLKQEALNAMMQTLEHLETKIEAKMIVLRDFSEIEPLHPYFQGQGFVRVQMPDSCKIDLKEHQTIESYGAKLSARNRQHLRKEILAYEPLLDIEIIKNGSTDQLNQVQVLYDNVHRNNLGLNTFSFPEKLFKRMSEHPNWEFITISLLESPSKMIGVMLCYNNGNQTYVPSFVGMDYDYLTKYHIYRQLLYQTIKRAIALNFKQIDLGMTASFEKRKLGAIVQEKFAYIQTSDNYTLELMGILEGHQ
ncbi:MAG: aminotransferase class I/II [Flavobacteriaceae bacterium CG17_big_fil_post_rev_8_21_14_2_50_33_15]|nr:MAG: aminotransferase class I/II [Flavobacteriaceae bacterium CG17_big_fil_post_rev_8_21_14_2_50_33_15]